MTAFLGLQGRVDDGATIVDLIEYLRSFEPFELTPFSFLTALQRELDISFTRARFLLEYFDHEMRPLADVEFINQCGRGLIEGTWP